MGLWSLLFGGGSDGGGDLEYLGSDVSCDDAVTEALYEGLDERDATIAKLQRKSNFQHEIIVGALDQVHQHEINRYEVVKKISPGVADKFFTPGRCDPFPEIDFASEVEADRLNQRAESDLCLPEDLSDRWI